jgi:hypothetical protein
MLTTADERHLLLMIDNLDNVVISIANLRQHIISYLENNPQKSIYTLSGIDIEVLYENAQDLRKDIKYAYKALVTTDQ